MGNSVGCCSDREKDEKELQASIGRRMGPAKESYRVTLNRKGPDDALGFEFTHEKKSIRILDIIEGALAHKWNLSNPDVQIRVGDSVVEVNGRRGKSQKLVDMLKESDGDVNLLLTREVVSFDSLDGYWRNGDRESICIKRAKIKWVKKDVVWTFSVQGGGKITAMNTEGDTYEATIVEGELHWDDDDVWVPDCQEYLMDNTVLKAHSKGMAYRYSVDLEDRVPEEEAGFAEWTTTIVGRDLENDWVVVQEKYYLPMKVSGIQVMIPVQKEAQAEEAPEEAGASAEEEPAALPSNRSFRQDRPTSVRSGV